MKNTVRPEWMKYKLKNENIDEILISIQKFVTDGTIQKLYEYIKEIEEKT